MIHLVDLSDKSLFHSYNGISYQLKKIGVSTPIFLNDQTNNLLKIQLKFIK
ncbi:hypothetical protein MCR_1767 [Moraxella catarrhalis BBH18]|nr:hypothetical protein MCR_1767 [Moraxella catarrhalis BBH18]EGE20071.1 hypothetical protein E9S_06278 [Moraxella catarrhalis BC7]